MTGPDQLRVLRREVEADLACVGGLIGQLQDARRTLPEPAGQKELAFVAYLLHGIYTGWEGALRRIATVFENRLDPAQWHAQLLQRMVLDIPSIRPAVIDPDLHLHLEKLRSFRHFFRHSYGTPLRQQEIKLVLEACDQTAPRMARQFEQFLVAVEAIARQADKE